MCTLTHRRVLRRHIPTVGLYERDRWRDFKARIFFTLSCQKESVVLQQVGDKVAVMNVNIVKIPKKFPLPICISTKQQFLNARKELKRRNS
ncbi:Uncharacterized protein DBV15_00587, partial [Temnothorax longispinosus]